MLIIRGVNLYPTQIEEIVLQNEHLSGQYQIVVSRDGLLDEIQVRCELREASAKLSEAQVGNVGSWLTHRVKAMVGVSCHVKVEAPGSIERTLVGKARRVVDRRPK
jgi:phenylacetate-CoA ligase